MKILLIHNRRPTANYVMPQITAHLEKVAGNAEMRFHPAASPFQLPVAELNQFDVAVIGIGD